MGWRGISLGGVGGGAEATYPIPARPFPEGKDQMRIQPAVESVWVKNRTQPGPGSGLQQNQEQGSVYSRLPSVHMTDIFC